MSSQRCQVLNWVPKMPPFIPERGNFPIWNGGMAIIMMVTDRLPVRPAPAILIPLTVSATP